MKSSKAATLASNGSASDVQAKINSAAPGDTVTLPAGGSFNWGVGAVNLAKAITLDGKNATIKSSAGTKAVLTIAAGSSLARLTGLNFDGGATQSVFIDVTGNGKVLIDHCALTGGSASEMIHVLGLGPSNAGGWTNDVHPGSDNAVYIEDCTFNKNPAQDQYFWGTSACQNYYGSRTVVRHCTMNYCQLDVHGTAGMIGGRWFEFYDNTFTIPSGGGNQSDYMAIRAGSGVIYNNKVTGGHNDGGGAINIYEEDSQDPADYQPGRGISQRLSPIYLWANSGLNPRAGSAQIKQDRDFYVSSAKPASMKRQQLSSDTSATTYAFSPLAYPHPMSGGGEPVPPDPIPPSPSTKFAIGERVAPSPNVANVRSAPAGELVGTQVVGAPGVVVDGPEWGQLSDASSGVYWWKIDFDSGSDGWVGEDNLTTASAPNPPNPEPEPTYEDWIKKQNDWIRANPPTPDP